MNYYEHHIRDYDAATAHLTWDEDMAYTRLMRWYYRKEQPIPAELAEACRQVRAVSKPQRDAVASVLREFFVLEPDGWHQKTCDEVINAYQAGEPEREVKKANEDNRSKRHREERARLFKVLTDAGEHAAWNIPISDLRELVQRITGPAPATPDTQPATAPVTPVTATQTPDTNTQTPEVKEEDKRAHSDSTEVARDPPTPLAEARMALKRGGIHPATYNPEDQVLVELVRQGAEPDELEALAREAIRKGIGKPLPWVTATLIGRRADAAAVRLAPKGPAPATSRAEQRAETIAGLTTQPQRTSHAEPDFIDVAARVIR